MNLQDVEEFYDNQPKEESWRSKMLHSSWFMAKEHCVEILWVLVFFFLFRAVEEENKRKNKLKLISRQMVHLYASSEIIQICLGLYHELFHAAHLDFHFLVCFLFYDFTCLLLIIITWCILKSNKREKPLGYNLLKEKIRYPKFVSYFMLPLFTFIFSFFLFILFLDHELNPSNFLSFSVRLLEAFAFLPQFILFRKEKKICVYIFYFIFCIFCHNFITSFFEILIYGFTGWFFLQVMQFLMTSDFVFFYFLHRRDKDASIQTFFHEQV